MAPHGWGNRAGRVDTPASLEGAGRGARNFGSWREAHRCLARFQRREIRLRCHQLVCLPIHTHIHNNPQNIHSSLQLCLGERHGDGDVPLVAESPPSAWRRRSSSTQPSPKTPTQTPPPVWCSAPASAATARVAAAQPRCAACSTPLVRAQAAAMKRCCLRPLLHRVRHLRRGPPAGPHSPKENTHSRHAGHRTA